jgi:hypothetical protein
MKYPKYKTTVFNEGINEDEQVEIDPVADML